MILKIPLEFWFTKNTGLALPIISFNHPVKSILWTHKMCGNKNEYKEYKLKCEIDRLCVEFNKLSIPQSFEEYYDKLTENEKEKLKNISNDDNIWLYNLLNIDQYIFL